jgi:HEPN domain-containing protein
MYLYQKLTQKPLEIICYHCQQAVEKSLKAFICATDIEIPRTHNTGELCNLCGEFDRAFYQIEDKCKIFTPFATETRYPGKREIAEATVERLLRQALEIHEFTVCAIDRFFGEV